MKEGTRLTDVAMVFNLEIMPLLASPLAGSNVIVKELTKTC